MYRSEATGEYGYDFFELPLDGGKTVLLAVVAAIGLNVCGSIFMTGNILADFLLASSTTFVILFVLMVSGVASYGARLPKYRGGVGLALMIFADLFDL